MVVEVEKVGMNGRCVGKREKKENEKIKENRMKHNKGKKKKEKRKRKMIKHIENKSVL